MVHGSDKLFYACLHSFGFWVKAGADAGVAAAFVVEPGLLQAARFG